MTAQAQVMVVIDGDVYPPWALRAGHHITKTEWDHTTKSLTLWVEKGEGYVETRWSDFPSWENV